VTNATAHQHRAGLGKLLLHEIVVGARGAIALDAIL
jgi:hypothetical protein